MISAADKFDWSAQLERTVTHSLVTTFGLDFLLFQDKRGGDVDTVQNVRQGVFVTDKEQERFESRGAYDPDPYHQDTNFISTGKAHKASHQKGALQDSYSKGAVSVSDERDLDHTIAAKEIHDDPGRVLAEKGGVDLANKDSNLNSTTSSVNRSKGQKPVAQFLAGLDEAIANKEQTIQRNKAKLQQLHQNTPQEQHHYRELQSKIQKEEALVEKLKSVDREKMAAKDEEARNAYDREINCSYYTSRKFFGSTATAAAQSGLKMGARQVVGLVMAELWFELKVQVPAMVSKARAGFQLDALIQDFKVAIEGIRARLEARLKDLWTEFKDGAIAGALSSVSTTVLNILLTSEKMVVKLIREMWSHLVKAVKLIAFNPDQLTTVDLAKAVTEVLAFGLASVVGAVVYAEAVAILQIPFGAELAAFAGALTTGLLTLALQYFLFHSDLMQRVWHFLSSKGKPSLAEQTTAANAELDRFLMELAMVELEMDMDELESFEVSLRACDDELLLNGLLAREIIHRGIELPFGMSDAGSTRKWLINKATTC